MKLPNAVKHGSRSKCKVIIQKSTGLKQLTILSLDLVNKRCNLTAGYNIVTFL